MSLNMGQWSVAGTVPIFTIPPGPCAVTMYVATGAVYTGLSTSLTTSNGMSVPTYPVMFQGFPGSQGSQLYATTGSTATTVAIHYVISSDK
jgi:hypothetical protein